MNNLLRIEIHCAEAKQKEAHAVQHMISGMLAAASITSEYCVAIKETPVLSDIEEEFEKRGIDLLALRTKALELSAGAGMDADFNYKFLLTGRASD